MGSQQVHVAHPAAVLWHFCGLSADYAAMLRECNNGVHKIQEANATSADPL
jgi:hypothetical protein